LCFSLRSDAFVLPGITPVQQAVSVKPAGGKDAAAAADAEDTGMRAFENK
jgi:hypothetical protein